MSLPWAEVERILGRFDQLNPYDPELVPSPWKVEAESTTTPLWCYAISAKRYWLYHLTESGDPEIIAAIDTNDEQDSERLDGGEEVLQDWSEHGLGLYFDPTTDDPDRPRRDSKGRRLWVAEAWRWILKDAHGHKPPLPAWVNAYALARFTVSSPRIERWFTGYNAARHPDEKIRPGSFGLIAHPIQLGTRQCAPRRTLRNGPRTLANTRLVRPPHRQSGTRHHTFLKR